MCGIAGIIQSEKGYYKKEQLHQMTAAIAHRGPDGVAHWESPTGEALLGHLRLSIIDLSPSAAQPMHYMGRYSILHNGEIYNYIELRSALEKKGYSFQTKSDTEVILAAYDNWKEDCVQHFNGMFSFALWDNEEQLLFAARDRFGEKPFFYCFDSNSLLFASEMKALWAAGIEKRSNLKMLFNYLTIGYVDNPEDSSETFYENIFKLPPASTLSYYAGDAEPLIERYWNLDHRERNTSITDNSALQQFNELLSDSVNKRLRSDVQIGSSLSGGLDSSSVIALLSQSNILNYSPTAFTAIFPGFEKDESSISAAVAGKFGLKQETVIVTGEDLLRDWEKLCYHQEEPFGSASIYAQYKVYELSRYHNVKVLLDGQGADETLAGYHKYYKWYWQELFIKRKLLRSKEIGAAHEKGIKEKFGPRNIVAALFPDIASVILERQYLVKALRQPDLDREFVRLQSREAYYTTPEFFDLNGVLYFNSCVHGLEELLRYADRNSMAFGREVRLPFLDHKLVEFVFSLPSRFKIRQGWTKWILRETMKDKLPAQIAWRKDKVGFEPPQRDWMQNRNMQEAIQEGRRKLVSMNILAKNVLSRPVTASSSHDANNADWRYFSAAAFV